MAMSIRTNVSSLNAQRNLYSTQAQLDSSLSRLGSGYRITKAGDDAAGLGISVNLQAQIRSYAQASRNAQDGISLVQTAEGSMNEITNILTRLRELAMESASSGLDGNDVQRSYIQTEADQLTSEIDRIANGAEYNGTALLNTNATSLTFQVGINMDGTDPGDVKANTIAMQTVNITTGDNGLKLTVADAAAPEGVRLKLSTQADAQAALATIDNALSIISAERAKFGAVGNRLNNAISKLLRVLEE